MARLRLESFFRLVWRWHFWAGLIATPTLLIVSITGALYAFRDDIRDWQHSSLVFVNDPGTKLQPIDDLVNAVKQHESSITIGLITIPAERTKSTMIQFKRPDGTPHIAFVDPYSAAVLGDIPLAQSPFWSVVLKLHSNLFAGLFGRVVVEITTAWTIVLVVSGVFLWIPKRWKRLGVWWPRFTAHRYTIIRDWHTIPGIYLAAIAILLGMTGLFFSPAWGGLYSHLTGSSGRYPVAFITAPACSDCPLEESPIPLSKLIDTARQRYPDSRLMVNPLRKPSEPYAVTVNGYAGSMPIAFLAMARNSGELVADRNASELTWLQTLRLWVYPLHVGSVGGMPTKILACLTCLMLAAAAMTGIVMWRIRKRKGDWGFPHRVETSRIPLWGGVMILVMGLLLPTVGISIVVYLIVFWILLPLSPLGRGWRAKRDG